MRQQIMLQEAFLIIKWEGFPVLFDLIGLIASIDFNWLSIDLKLVIIDFRISADYHPFNPVESNHRDGTGHKNKAISGFIL